MNSPICDRCRRSGTKKPCPIDGCGILINAYARTCIMHRHIKTESPSICVECGAAISRGQLTVCKPCQGSVKVLCACGCGKWRKKYGCTGLPHEYISGHNDSWVDARRPELACAFCRKTFQSATPRQRLCGIECRTKWLTLNPPNERKRIPLPCSGCGATVYRSPYQVRAIKLGVTCSHRCRAGLVGLALAERVTQGKKVARLRDGAACRICGFALLSEVHHIVPKREGGSDDPSNLITLCPTHHEMADRDMIPRAALFAAISEARREDQEPDQGPRGVAPRPHPSLPA